MNLGLALLLHPLLKPPINIQRDRHIDDIRHNLRPHDPIHSKHPIEDIQHGNVQDQPAHDSQEQGDSALSEAVEQVHGEKAQEHKRCGQAADSQEISSQRHGLRVADEYPGYIQCKNFVQYNADRRADQPDPAREHDGILHPLAVAGGIIVGHNRHHALADTDADVEGQALDFQHNPDRRHLNVAVGRHQPADHNIVKVEQECGQRGGDSHIENAFDALLRR